MSTISSGTTLTTALVQTGDTTGNLVIKTGSSNTTAMTISGSDQSITFAGAVNVASTAFANGSASAPSITFTGDTNTGIFSPAADTIAFTEGGAESMRIDSSGNVGIGTSSPFGKLDVVGTAYVSSASSNPQQLAFFANTTASYISSTYQGSGSYKPLAFEVAGSERMRIDSSGQALFGTTVTDPTFSRSNGVNISAGSILSRSAGGWDCGISGSSGNNINFYTDNGSSRVSAGFISSNGGTSTYATSSDYRMKEDVQPISNALNSVMQLKPVNYKWKPEFAGTKINGQGFIAHELQAVVPDCVTGEKDAVDAYGNPKYQGIDTSFLVATLTAAIQEQQAIITEQANTIAAFEVRLSALENLA